MKKIIIIVSILFLVVQVHAQCVSLPFKPTFNVAADTTAWLKMSNQTGTNPSVWRFQTVNSEGGSAFFPFLSVQSPTSINNQIVTLYSPCISLNSSNTYELRFSVVGLTPKFMNKLTVWLAADTIGYSNDNNTFTHPGSITPFRPPASDTFRLITTIDVPFGTTEVSALINDFPPAAATSGNYRLVFKSENVSIPIPITGGYYVIESYLKNIALNVASAEKMRVVAMTGPLSNCNLSGQTMSFNVQNLGYDTATNYTIYYQISTDSGVSFGTPVPQQFFTPIPFDSVVELSFTAPQSFSAPLTLVNAWVTYGGQTSDTLRNQQVRETTRHTVPYNCSFNNETVFSDWSIIPGKILQPNVTWRAPLSPAGAMMGRVDIATSGEASNDRLVSGCIELVAGTLYQVSFSYNAQSNASRENLSLYVGRSKRPQLSDETLMNLRGFNSTDVRTLSAYYRPTTSGTYFFGFWAYSAALSAGISISDFTIVVAEEPAKVPVYMGFEAYDDFEEGWQIYSQNAIDSTVSGNPMRGWLLDSTTTTNIFTGDVGLRTISAPNLTSTSSTATGLDTNNNWLISKPIHLEVGKPIEILYFRRAMISGEQEILNIRVSRTVELQTLSQSPPLFRDTATSNVYSAQRVYFTPDVGGTYFVTFQYNSVGRRTGSNGMSLDEISIQDSTMAQDTNLSIISLTIPDPACSFGNNQIMELTIKNRSKYTIPTGSLRADFEVTNPSEVTTVYRANDPSTFSSIAPFQTGTIRRTALDMRALGVWKARAWISRTDNSPTGDTSEIVQTVATGTLVGRYDMGFEPHERINYWSNSRIGNQRFWWQFITDAGKPPANTGVGVAMVAPTKTAIASRDTIRPYITSPCLRLNAGLDSSYLISFYYRAVEDSSGAIALNPVTLNVYVGSSRVPLETQLRDSFSTNSTEYKLARVYYKPQTSGTHYIIFEAVSGRQSTGIYLDDILIMDSISANMPNLSINNIWITSKDKCDFTSKDTLYVEIESKGFLPYENPKFDIEINGQTPFEDTWIGTVPPDTTIVIKLPAPLSYTGYGEHNVKVSVNAQDNQAEQLSATTKSIKEEPKTPPYTVTFHSSQLLPWNNLEQPISALQNPTFNYWKFGGTGNNTFAYFENGSANVNQKPGILASGCLELEPNEDYVIVYQYRGVSLSATENLQVLREKSDKTTEILFTDNDIRTDIYTTKTLQLKGTGGNRERIRFLSNHNPSAQGIRINSFTIEVDSSAWPADAKMVGIVTPRENDTGLNEVEPIVVEVTNLNSRPLINLHVWYQIDDREPILDSISRINKDSTVIFHFRQRADFLPYGSTHRVAAWVDAPGDIDRSNDTVRKTVINHAPIIGSIEDIFKESIVMIFPNPATTEVFIKSEKEMSTLFIHDMKGHLVKEIRVNHTEYHLNTNHFSAGLYLFTIQIENERVFRRVIINHQP